MHESYNGDFAIWISGDSRKLAETPFLTRNLSDPANPPTCPPSSQMLSLCCGSVKTLLELEPGASLPLVGLADKGAALKLLEKAVPSNNNGASGSTASNG